MSHNGLLEVINPSNGEVIDSVECDSAEQIENKIQTCAQTFVSPDVPLNTSDRIAILEHVYQQMIEQKAYLAKLISQEGGKPFRDALVEAQRAAFGIKLAVSHLLSAGTQTSPLNTFPSTSHFEMTVTHQPIGPVIAVSAFNHPLNLVTHQLVSAFAAGCPCLIKPAGDTPLSCIRLINMFAEAGMPKGWMNYVITTDNAAAEAIVTDPRFAFFSFIGSAKVGWYLRSKLPPGTRCALEHGGVAPAFVDHTADLDLAVASLVKGAYYHAGQVCVSTQRIYVSEKIFDQFEALFCRAVNQLKVGDACLDSTDVGPLIRMTEVNRVHDWVEQAQLLGGVVCTGGKPVTGQFYAPTVISHAPAQAMINSLEVFGPVCSLMPYSDLESQIQQINRENVSFHSAVFSDSNHTIQTLYSKLQTGCLMVNEHTAFRHDAMTFAGLKHSGLGSGGMPNSIHHMQVDKLKIVNSH